MINLIANLSINLLLALHSGLAGVYEIISKKVYCNHFLAFLSAGVLSLCSAQGPRSMSPFLVPFTEILGPLKIWEQYITHCFLLQHFTIYVSFVYYSVISLLILHPPLS